MHRDDHVSPLTRHRGSCETLLEGIIAEGIQHVIVDAHTKVCRSRVVEYVPRDGVLGHQFVEGDVVVVGPNRSILRVDIDDITMNLSRIELVKGIPQRIRRGSVAAARVAHENLDGADIIIDRGR